MAEPEVDQRLRELRDCMQFASVSQFMHIFHTVFGYEEFDTEDLEHEFLSSDSLALGDMFSRLLRSLTLNRHISHDNWQQHLVKEFQKRAPTRNPFEEKGGQKHIDFFTFDPLERAKILYQVCEWQLDDPERFRGQIKNEDDAMSWRVEPIGYDAKRNKYWLFDDNRLYRERPPDPPKPKPNPPKKPPRRATRNSGRLRDRPSGPLDSDSELSSPDEALSSSDESTTMGQDVGWDCMCVTTEEWLAFSERFRRSRNPDELRLHSTLTKEVVPRVCAALVERAKERARQEAIANRKRSSRIIIKELERIEKDRMEEVRKNEMREAIARRKETLMKRREEKEKMSAIALREVRAREREARILAREQMISEREQRKAKEERRRERERAGRAGRRAKAREKAEESEIGEAEEQEDHWVFDCLCGVYGENLDDGSPMIACGRCGVWQHIHCLQNDISSDNYNRKDWENVDFICRHCQESIAGRAAQSLVLDSDTPADVEDEETESEGEGERRRSKSTSTIGIKRKESEQPENMDAILVGATPPLKKIKLTTKRPKLKIPNHADSSAVVNMEDGSVPKSIKKQKRKEKIKTEDISKASTFAYTPTFVADAAAIDWNPVVTSEQKKISITSPIDKKKYIHKKKISTDPSSPTSRIYNTNGPVQAPFVPSQRSPPSFSGSSGQPPIPLFSPHPSILPTVPPHPSQPSARPHLPPFNSAIPRLPEQGFHSHSISSPQQYHINGFSSFPFPNQNGAYPPSSPSSPHYPPSSPYNHPPSSSYNPSSSSFSQFSHRPPPSHHSYSTTSIQPPVLPPLAPAPPAQGISNGLYHITPPQILLPSYSQVSSAAGVSPPSRNNRPIMIVPQSQSGSFRPSPLSHGFHPHQQFGYLPPAGEYIPSTGMVLSPGPGRNFIADEIYPIPRIASAQVEKKRNKNPKERLKKVKENTKDTTVSVPDKESIHQNATQEEKYPVTSIVVDRVVSGENLTNPAPSHVDTGEVLKEGHSSKMDLKSLLG